MKLLGQIQPHLAVHRSLRHFSTPAQLSRIFMSRIFHPCYVVCRIFLSCIFHPPPLHFCAAFSHLAFSTPAFFTVPYFHVRIFSRSIFYIKTDHVLYNYGGRLNLTEEMSEEDVVGWCQGACENLKNFRLSQKISTSSEYTEKEKGATCLRGQLASWILPWNGH